MKRCTGAGLVALALALSCSGSTFAEQVATDANIVTALDTSDSISAADIQLELAGMADAIRDPRVLRAIKSGAHGRIGFAVFTWHHDQFSTVVSWSVIETQDDATRAAQAIELRTLVNVEMETRASEEWFIGRLTNLSQAIDHARAMLKSAPFASARAVINIVGNGDDNVGEEAGPARDRVVADGATINGLVLGGAPATVAYYRGQVIGGRAAFVMSTGDAASIADAFVRKFIGDIVAAAAPGAGAQPPAIHSGGR